MPIGCDERDGQSFAGGRHGRNHAASRSAIHYDIEGRRLRIARNRDAAAQAGRQNGRQHQGDDDRLGSPPARGGSMKRQDFFLCASGVALAAQTALSGQAPTQPRPLRVIAFGAHPDDAELKASGVAAMWAAQGAKVKFVAMTNGDIGHFSQAGGPLARRRKAEVAECARILGIENQVLDIHDGELMPSLENRRTMARLIREWQADIVLGHRPYDYHPDHRYTGVLMDDSAVLVVAPFFVPDTPPTPRNPVFMYYSDNFQDPKPFTPTVVVGIDA